MGDTNNHEQNIERIKEALGNPDECEIIYRLKRNKYLYIIRPQNNQEKLHINMMNNIMGSNHSKIHLLQYCNLAFENCVFEHEVLLRKAEIQCELRFCKCIFKNNVDFMNSIFKELVDFSENTFEQHIYFQRTVFSENAYFQKILLKGDADFQFSTFRIVNFSGSIFEEQALFSKTNFKQKISFDNVTFHGNAFFDSEFHSEAIFDNSNFKMEAVFSDSIFKKTSNFNKTVFGGYARFDNVNFNDMANFSSAQFKSGAVFSEAHFNYGTSFKAAKFSGYTWFKKATFCNDVNFNGAIFEKDVLFDNATFAKLAYFPNVGFYGLAKFSDVTFHKSIFGGSRFKERAFFLKAHFQGDTFLSNVIFEHNAYFDEAEFLEEANFKQSEFYMNAHFYGTRFKEIPQRDNITMNDIPNFLQIILNGYINLTNTKQLLLSFEQLKSIIDRNSEKQKDELANEFRNTFRNFKNGLIKDNNTIDASQFHKMELYAKELEINYKKEKAAKDWAEKIQLLFYRFTSDHHTDLMLILTNVLVLIVLFAIISIILLFCADYLLKWIGYNDECLVLGQSHYLFTMLPKHIHEYIKPIVWGKIAIIITLCAAFVYVFKYIMCHIYAANNNKKLHHWFIVVFLVNAFILAVKPAIMLPIFGKLIDESLKIDFPAFTSLSVVYAILMFLLIWSLQKTARKNTIIPN